MKSVVLLLDPQSELIYWTDSDRGVIDSGQRIR